MGERAREQDIAGLARDESPLSALQVGEGLA